MRTLVVAALLLASPVLAQSRVGTVRESPFASGTSRIYDNEGAFVGTARDNAFVPGRTDLYDSEGRSTGVQIRDNAFDSDRRDIFDEQPADEW